MVSLRNSKQVEEVSNAMLTRSYVFLQSNGCGLVLGSGLEPPLRE